MSFINCGRDCKFQQFGSCFLDDLNYAEFTSSDNDCCHYSKRKSSAKFDNTLKRTDSAPYLDSNL